jgi:hypothetical protein
MDGSDHLNCHMLKPFWKKKNTYRCNTYLYFLRYIEYEETIGRSKQGLISLFHIDF